MCLFLWGWIFLVYLQYYIYGKKFFQLWLTICLWFLSWVFVWYYNFQDIDSKRSIIWQYNTNQEYLVSFMIQDVYKKIDFDIDYKVKILKISNQDIDKNIYALLKTKKNFSFMHWDILEVTTPIKSIDNFSETFDYEGYMNSRNIYTIFYAHNFDKIWYEEPHEILKILWKFRSQMLLMIHKLYPKNEAVFLWWILIWAREAIPDWLSDSFNNSWLTHLIAVSGYNITIIIVFLSYILALVPKALRVCIITICVVLYLFIVWYGAAVLRATIMWLVGYYVLMSGRKWDSLAILLFSAWSMLVFNPFLINYDIGFQLSFLAVFGLLYTQKFFEKIFFFLPKKFAIQESFVLTLSAFVFTVPIMIYNFGQISILAPIANMIVWWTIPFAMAFWSLSLLVFSVSESLWYLVGLIAYAFLKWTTSVATYFGSIDLALLKIDLWEGWIYFQIVYFLLVIFCLLFFSKKEA